MFVLSNQNVSDSLDETLDKYNKIEILEEKEPNKDYLDKVFTYNKNQYISSLFIVHFR